MFREDLAIVSMDRIVLHVSAVRHRETDLCSMNDVSGVKHREGWTNQMSETTSLGSVPVVSWAESLVETVSQVSEVKRLLTASC